MSTDIPSIGFSKEWKAFFKRHPSWPDKYKLLHNTFEKVFLRPFEQKNAADKLIFFMGRLCVEDFNEIFLMCGNGYGFGGLKILRGLYERAVTLGYLAKNTDQAEVFLDYHHIHKYKMLKHAKTFFNKIDDQVSSAEIKYVEALYNQNRAKFEQVICKNCNTKRIRLSWSSLDLASMAKKAGMEELYFSGYYYPTLQTHATATAVISRMKPNTDGGVSFDEESQRDWSDKALIASHNVMLRILI